MFAENLDQTLERWKKAFRQYSELKAEAEWSVTRWEWTTAERYSLLPFHFERFPGRGRVIPEPPSAGACLCYGFDEQGRVRLHRYYFHRGSERQGLFQKVFAPGKDLYSETFYHYNGPQMELIEYSAAPQIPLKVEQIFTAHGRVEFHTRFNLNGYTPLYSQKRKDPDTFYAWLGYNGRYKTAEQYLYAMDRLASVLSYNEVPGVEPYSFQEDFTYTESGQLARIERVYSNGRKEVAYQKRQKGLTLESIRRAAIQNMVAAIVARLRAAQIQGRFYCIVLSYQRVIRHFPPAVCPVPESYRRDRITSASSNDLDGIYLPLLQAEWFLEIDDPDALEICQILEHEIQAGEKWDLATQTLREVAAALTRQDWSGILDVTPDFVVYALDAEMEGDNLAQVLGASVSANQIQEWKDKGWLR